MAPDPWRSPEEAARAALLQATVVAALATVALLVGIALFPERLGFALTVSVLALGALALRALAQIVGSALPLASVAGFVRLPTRGRPQPPPEQLARLVSLLRFSSMTSGDLHVRLRPLLRDVAGYRLAARHGVDLASQPDLARAILGPAAWDLVRPDRPEPADRQARGADPETLAAIIAALESV